MRFCKNYKCILLQCNAMKKDFVISRIEASQDGAPYVYIALNDPNDFSRAPKAQNSFGPNMMAFTSPEDMMRICQKPWQIFLRPWVEAACQRIPLHSKSV